MTDPIEEAFEEPIPQEPVKKVYHKAKGICVVLEDDMLKEDVDPLMDAIRLLAGVLEVNYIDFDGFNDYPNRTRARIELKNELKAVLEE